MLSPRMEQLKKEYLETTPSISSKRAVIFTKSHKKTEGERLIIRRAKAFRDVCNKIYICIFPNELIVGNIGEFRRSGIICPEYSWSWVKKEMDNFPNRPQDQYEISTENKKILNEEVFPYWQGKSLEETFLARLDKKTAKLLVDTGIVDNDSKWRSAVGEITADYQDIIFTKGFGGLKKEAEEKLAALSPLTPDGIDKITFYQAEIITCEGIITLANRYAAQAAYLANTATGSRQAELLEIADICSKVPENPPQTFKEAIQCVWFTQLGSILSENSLALNLGRFDQYMYPYYKNDLSKNIITHEAALERIEALWLKLSEWVWAISSNTAQYFAGYNSFQNLTIGGRKRDGSDATNEISYMCLEATSNLKTHQPGLSVRIHPNCPPEFLREVCKLVRLGTGFPAIHNDSVGSQMLVAAGLSPEDARDWSNCGCVVPHFRKIGEWTSAVNINLAAAMEYTINNGYSNMTNTLMGLATDINTIKTYDEFKQIFFKQIANLIKTAVTGSIICQQVHKEIVPRPYISLLVDGCMEKGKDLSQGGAQYCLGPVLTGIGLADTANSLAAIKYIVFEKQEFTLQDFAAALKADWLGFEKLHAAVFSAPKYGNDDDYVDYIATEISDFYHSEIHQYKDLFGAPFNSAFMGISNYIPCGSVIGATPDGRKAGAPLTEGVSPHAGTDITSPTAAMRSAAKINHDIHQGGTLVNVKVSPDLIKTDRGLTNLAALIKGYFALGAFHIQFNVISPEILFAAQEHPENYRDLLVRVAGYSTQFVNLSRKAQNAIIERTTYETM
ncbi:glycyl radical protein [Pectinatus brassicae]|uniref:Formate C-acetyltransferase n=1 Tax=Pectinatus brassicae TaxID=862415 RepID=A0A840UGH1_9FIRM|nr:formate C-acetyltransferase/glycerol dehydratase family glycyl radical enzyme [Pectinatus brassicae]MBB5336109.1 formate C-acetyltransferase [Pectinatus brassicae]